MCDARESASKLGLGETRHRFTNSDANDISPTGLRVDTKSKLMRQLGSTLDLSTFDFQLGKHMHQTTLFMPLQSPSSAMQHNHQQQLHQHQQHHQLPHSQRSSKRSASVAGMDALPLAVSAPTATSASTPSLKHPFDYRLYSTHTRQMRIRFLCFVCFLVIRCFFRVRLHIGMKTQQHTCDWLNHLRGI